MSDPATITDPLAAAVDAFTHTSGPPDFEPGINPSVTASRVEVAIQKACRLLETRARLDELGPYYGAIVEQSVIAIEQTVSGYLLAITGIDERELRDHQTPYEVALGQVPLTDRTVQTIQQLFEERRSEHYYQTTVSTAEQANSMQTLANEIHRHIVAFDPTLERFRRCE